MERADQTPLGIPFPLFPLMAGGKKHEHGLCMDKHCTLSPSVKAVLGVLHGQPAFARRGQWADDRGRTTMETCFLLLVGTCIVARLLS